MKRINNFLCGMLLLTSITQASNIEQLQEDTSYSEFSLSQGPVLYTVVTYLDDVVDFYTLRLVSKGINHRVNETLVKRQFASSNIDVIYEEYGEHISQKLIAYTQNKEGLEVLLPLITGLLPQNIPGVSDTDRQDVIEYFKHFGTNRFWDNMADDELFYCLMTISSKKDLIFYSNDDASTDDIENIIRLLFECPQEKVDESFTYFTNRTPWSKKSLLQMNHEGYSDIQKWIFIKANNWANSGSQFAVNLGAWGVNEQILNPIISEAVSTTIYYAMTSCVGHDIGMEAYSLSKVFLGTGWLNVYFAPHTRDYLVNPIWNKVKRWI